MRTSAFLILVVLCSSGCSYFKSNQRLDLAPFAERTWSLAADIEYSIVLSGSAHYLRAHRNLSEGVTDPAKLDIFDLTKKAVNTVL